jgi:hypothetical protein
MPFIADNIISENNLTATTISATTYLGLPIDIRVTGGTYTTSAGTATFTNNTGGTFNVSGFTTGSTSVDTFVTGGTYSNGTAIFRNNTGGTFSVSGFVSADTFVTAYTYSNNLFTIARNQGQPNLTALINTMTGLTVNGTLSATTYAGLPTDIRVTGGTYSNGTAIFRNNTGGTFSVSGFVSADTYTTGFTFNNGTYNLTIGRNDGVNLTTNLGILVTDVNITGGTYNPNTGSVTFRNNTGGTFTVTGFASGFTDTFVTGGTYSNGTAIFRNNTGGTFSVSGFVSADTYVTAYTYSNNTFTIKQNNSQPNLTALINTMTGLTVTGGISATTISATTFFGSASGLTNITGGAVEVSSSGTVTTTSSTPVLLTSMSALTVNSTYLALFSGVFNSSNGSAIITIALYVGGVQLATSSRPCQFNNQTEVSLMDKVINAPSGTTIEVRWSTSGPGTATAINRSLILI